MVSVLLDAGAGPKWKYTEHGETIGVSKVAKLRYSRLDRVDNVGRLVAVRGSPWHLFISSAVVCSVEMALSKLTVRMDLARLKRVLMAYTILT